MPEFPSGNKKLNQYLADHLRYPQKEMGKNIQRTVVAQFYIEKDGQVSNTRIIKNLNLEAYYLLKNMPRWIPGTLDREITRLPITFKLE